MSSSSRLPAYLLGGLLIGGFWYLNRDRPLWEDVVRTVVVFSILMTVLRLRLRRRGIEVQLFPLIATKAVLVVIAAVIEDTMDRQSVSNSPLIVAIGLGLAVCLAGWVGDTYFFRRIGGPSS
jgi:hypothetical protein